MSERSIIKTQSTISEITVYPDSAVVKRTTELKLEPGEHIILFSDIIPRLNEDTLRVSASGEGKLKIGGARLKREYLTHASSEKIRELQERLQVLGDEKQQLEDELKIRTEEKQFLDSFKVFATEQLPREMVTKMPTVNELSETYRFFSSHVTENYHRTMETRLQLLEVAKNMEALQKEYKNISNHTTKEILNIEVPVRVTTSGAFEISVSFQVAGACWQPLYDARADITAENIELVSYGLVTQTTGEDWADVEMYLSTAKPSTGGNMPEPTPWVLRPYYPPPPRPVPPRMAKKEMSRVVLCAAPMVCEESKGYADESLADLLEESYSESETKGTSVVYKLPGKVTVKADGAEHKLPLSTQTMAAEFEYSTYPAGTQAAYLRSRVVNSGELQLLAGKVNIFLDEDFTGSSNLDNIGPGEEFNLYLGMDENVKVRRDLIEKKAADKTLGGLRQITYKYKLTVENYKAKKVMVNLFEAVPVSEDAKIKVKTGQVSQEPDAKDWQDKKGIWLWQLELEPRDKKEIVWSFSVEYPREIRVEGL